MMERITFILNKNLLDLHGYCSFSGISESLLPCRGLERLKSVFSGSPPSTVIAVLFPYKVDSEPGNLSRYARVPDYHSAAGRLLEQAAGELAAEFPRYRFLSFIDNSPIPEVRAAALSGLGVMGDNGLLINPVYGSWVFIGTIVTDLPFEIKGSQICQCHHCGACKAACPGGCIGTGSRDTCISRISQIKGSLTREQESLLKSSGMVWGCDYCQDVCPLNSKALINPHPCFGGIKFAPSLSFKDLDNLEGKAYSWRGAEVLRRNLSLLNEKK